MIVGELRTSPEEWDARFYGMAEFVAERFSKDPRRKVGSVLVSADRRQLSLGYNGFPHGTPDVKSRLMDDDYQRMFMVHGEVNAIVNAPFDVAEATLYVTKFPCHTCAGIIANARIAGLVSPAADFEHRTWGESYRAAVEILMDAGVVMTSVSRAVEAGRTGE